MTKRRLYLAGTLLALGLLGGAAALWPGGSDLQTVSWAGQTMGTVYHITVRVDRRSAVADLKDLVTRRLETINDSMSTFRPESEISRFNDLPPAPAALPVSADLLQVIRLGRRLYRLTDGAWDGTVWPLVQLWGFDRSERRTRLPEPEKIAAARRRVGFSQVVIVNENQLRKKAPGVVLDLGSVAKGYGVDQIAALLKAQGLVHFLVEIGGEVYAAGQKNKGQPWTVGINVPRRTAGRNQVAQALALSDRAVATSGDYRNFFTIAGRTYGHVLDPNTGYPVQTGVVSASVVADSCALADGLATAAMVLGKDKALNLINSLAKTEALLIVRDPKGAWKNYMSKNFQALRLN